jgi:hypothetical protein
VSAEWAQLADKGEVDLDEIMKDAPATVAELILSRRYGCGEAGIRSRLSRSS